MWDRFFIKFGKVSIILLITIILSLTIETLSWILLNISVHNTKLQNDKNIELLYNSNDINSIKTMLAETWNRQPMFRREPFIEFVEKEYKGKFVTISAYGYREVKNQENIFINHNKINIFVFGGSTTFGYGVNNDETIPSYLQDLLNRKYGDKFAVYNFGTGYHYSSQERIWFEQFIVNGFIPDIVVFIDGLNDFYYSNDKDQTEFSDSIIFKEDISSLSSLKTIIFRLIERSSTLSILKDRLFSKFYLKNSENKIKGLSDYPYKIYKEDDQKIYRAIYRLKMNRQMIKAICKGLQIIPIFVQQPVPTYNYDNSKRSVPVSSKMIGKHINSKKGYEFIMAQLSSGQIKNKNIVWCQDLKIDGNQFIDTVHYSPRYNLQIATKVAEFIDINNYINNTKRIDKKIKKYY